MNLPNNSTISDLRRSVWSIFRAKSDPSSSKFYNMTVPESANGIVLGFPTSDDWTKFEILDDKEKDDKAVTVEQVLSRIKKMSKSTITGIAAKPAVLMEGEDENVFKIKLPAYPENAT